MWTFCKRAAEDVDQKQIIKHLLIDYQYLKLHYYYIEKIGRLFNLKINELEMISKHFQMIYEH